MGRLPDRREAESHAWPYAPSERVSGYGWRRFPDNIEFCIGTNPNKVDTDNDGISDGAEIKANLDPLSNVLPGVALVSGLTLHGPANQVTLSGAGHSATSLTGYVATGSYGLAIIDLSEPKRPIILSELALPGNGNASGVAVDDGLHIAVVADNAGGLDFVDVSDPLHPAIIARSNTPASHVQIGDGITYASVGTALESFDTSTGDLLQVLSLGGQAINGLALEGQTLYTMDAAKTLRAIDISGPAMVAHGSITLPHGGGQFIVNHGIAYAAVADSDPQGGYVTVNVANRDQLTLISDTDIDATGAAIAHQAIGINGSGLGVMVGTSFNPGHPNELDILNVSDPQNTFNFVNRVSLPAPAFDVAVASGLAIVADGDGGLQVVNFLPGLIRVSLGRFRC